MNDAALIARVQALKPAALEILRAGGPGIERDPPWSGSYRSDLPDSERRHKGLLRVTNPLVIEAAWGPRRVSKRLRGMTLLAYPKEFSATPAMIESWITDERPYASIVIAKKKAQARIDAALGRVQIDPEAAEAEPPDAITQDEISDMLAERVELRAARQFADADKIRDYLTRHGVAVQDRKVVAHAEDKN